MAELGQITGVNPSLLQGGLIRHNNLRQIDENDDSQSESDNSDEESIDWYIFLNLKERAF